MRRPVIAVVGAGAMGAQHARVVAASPACELGVVIDTDADRAAALAARHGTKASTHPAAAIVCDAAIVATATGAHVAVATELLRSGLPVLVEKPVSHLLDEVESLVHDAQRLAVPLMCGFVERHNPAVATARSQLPASPEHLVALRHSPAPGRSLGSVVGDLLIHDLDLAVLFAGEPPDSLQATGTVVGGVVEAVDVLLAFPSGARAALSASRRAQRKVRSWFLTGGDVDIELDLVRQDVTCFRHRDHSLGPGLAYRAATEVEIPFVRHGGEPLDLQLRHFLGLLHGSVDPGAELASILPAHRLAAEVDALLPVPEAAAPLRALRRGTVAGLGAGS